MARARRNGQTALTYGAKIEVRSYHTGIAMFLLLIFALSVFWFLPEYTVPMLFTLVFFIGCCAVRYGHPTKEAVQFSAGLFLVFLGLLGLLLWFIYLMVK